MQEGKGGKVPAGGYADIRKQPVLDRSVPDVKDNTVDSFRAVCICTEGF